MILDRYFARRFLWTFAWITVVFLVLIALIDMIEQLGHFSSEAGFGQVLGLVLLNTPAGIYQILPLIMILAAIAMFLGLARTSELVVTRATGRSALRALAAPAVTAFVIGCLGLAFFNPIVAATSKRFSALSELYRSGGTNTLSLSAEGIWLRQGDGESQTVIHAARANPEATTLFDVTFLEYAPTGGPLRRIEAARARLDAGDWLLEDTKTWPLGRSVNPEADAVRQDTLRLNSTLTEDRIRDSFGQPSAISFWDLPAYIEQLEDAGFSARRHAVWLQMELSQPLFLVALVVISAAFTMQHQRTGRTGVAVLTTILLGFALYYVRNFAQILGENGQIPIPLAAWAPPSASLLLGLGLVLHREEG